MQSSQPAMEHLINQLPSPPPHSNTPLQGLFKPGSEPRLELHPDGRQEVERGSCLVGRLAGVLLGIVKKPVISRDSPINFSSHRGTRLFKNDRCCTYKYSVLLEFPAQGHTVMFQLISEEMWKQCATSKEQADCTSFIKHKFKNSWNFVGPASHSVPWPCK